MAFALSGGGAFGSVQVGMLRALLDRGVVPDLVVGSSVGALHGAFLAASADTAGPDPDGNRSSDAAGDICERLSRLWLTMDRRSLFGGRRTMVKSLLTTRTLSNFTKLKSLIDDHLPTDSFEDLNLPFAAVATDALTGEPELLSNGSVRQALLASAAVPGVFPAVNINGKSYVDGGVAANVPIRQAIAFGANSVICLDATPPVVAERVPSSLTGALHHSVSLMLRNQRSHAVEELASRYRIAVLPSATPANIGTFNFARTQELLDNSYRLAGAAIDGWLGDQARLNS